jgi:serine/threonine-protein kinase HipA
MKRPVLQQSVKVALGQAALPVGVLTFNIDAVHEKAQRLPTTRRG